MRKILIPALCCSTAAAPAAATGAAHKNDDPIPGRLPPPHGVTQRQDKGPRFAIVYDRIRRKHARHRARVRARRRAALAHATVPTAATGPTSAPAGLQSIAACESGGNPQAVGGGGQFRGKYQFDQSTWQSVGGTGDPAAAPVAEQDRRAAMLLARRGTAPWPVCGR